MFLFLILLITFKSIPKLNFVTNFNPQSNYLDNHNSIFVRLFRICLLKLTTTLKFYRFKPYYFSNKTPSWPLIKCLVIPSLKSDKTFCVLPMFALSMFKDLINQSLNKRVKEQTLSV